MTAPYLTERGAAAADNLWGDGAHARMERYCATLAEQTDETFARILTDFVTNGMYARGILPDGVRELCAVAALTVLNRPDELRGHFGAALRHNSLEHVREVVLQMAVYGGVPALHSALAALDEVAGEADAAS